MTVILMAIYGGHTKIAFRILHHVDVFGNRCQLVKLQFKILIANFYELSFAMTMTGENLTMSKVRWTSSKKRRTRMPIERSSIKHPTDPKHVQ